MAELAPQQDLVTTPADMRASLAEIGPPVPVFIHSSFRTSSTWIWSKVRKLPTTTAYYEVFHEDLQTFTATTIGSLDGRQWPSRHPSVAPYFLEYLPVLKNGGGVIGYDSNMGLARFIPENGLYGDLSLQEQSYLQMLVLQAGRTRKLPVLTCTRSLGRMLAIKHALQVKNVLLYRNIFHQWASYTGQYLRGNPYFMLTIDRTIRACGHDALLSGLDQCFPGRVATPQDEGTFTVFILMHLYVYAHAIDAADLVIDATALETDADLRRSIERDLSELVGGTVDLSDAHAGFEASLVAVRDRTTFIDTVEQFVKLITSTCRTDRAVAFVSRLKQEFLTEWDRHDRFTRRSTAWHVAEIDTLKRRIEAIAAEPGADKTAVAALTAENETLKKDLADAATSLTAAEAKAASLAGERDGLAGRLAEAATSLTAAEEKVVSLAGERDGLAGRLAEATADLKASHEKAASLAGERDGLAGRLADAAAALTASQEKAASLAGERDGLAGRLADAAAALTASQENAASLAGERDGLAGRLAAAAASLTAAEEKVVLLAGERDGLARRLAEPADARTAETAAAPEGAQAVLEVETSQQSAAHLGHEGLVDGGPIGLISPD